MKPMPQLEIPCAVQIESLRGTIWNCCLSETTPWMGRNGGRSRYADWLDCEKANKKGLYIWLHKRSKINEGEFRFIHVGISAKGASTLAARTKAHCRNQFLVDRVHEIKYDTSDGFGTLGNNLRGHASTSSLALVDVAERFLEDLRVLYLLDQAPLLIDDSQAKRIRDLEGLIAHTAAHLLGHNPDPDGQWEITNTLARTTNHARVACEHVVELAAALNKVCDMLPASPRQLRTTHGKILNSGCADV